MLRSIIIYSGAVALALLISCPVVAMRVDRKMRAEAKEHADQEHGHRRKQHGGLNAPLMTKAEIEAEYISLTTAVSAKIEEVLRKTQKVVKKVDQPVVAVPQIRCVDEFSDEERESYPEFNEVIAQLTPSVNSPIAPQPAVAPEIQPLAVSHITLPVAPISKPEAPVRVARPLPKAPQISPTKPAPEIKQKPKPVSMKVSRPLPTPPVQELEQEPEKVYPVLRTAQPVVLYKPIAHEMAYDPEVHAALKDTAPVAQTAIEVKAKKVKKVTFAPDVEEKTYTRPVPRKKAAIVPVTVLPVLNVQLGKTQEALCVSQSYSPAEPIKDNARLMLPLPVQAEKVAADIEIDQETPVLAHAQLIKGAAGIAAGLIFNSPSHDMVAHAVNCITQ